MIDDLWVRMIRDPTFRGSDKYIYIYSIQEIQLLVSFVKREQKEDDTSRFIAEILGPRAVSVVYVCFVCWFKTLNMQFAVLLSLGFPKANPTKDQLV